MKTRSILTIALASGGVVGSIWGSVPPALSMSSEERERIETSVYYSGCNEVRAAGKAPIYAGEPGYRSEMDGDSDGIACEPYRH
jgi:hypothetical protein